MSRSRWVRVSALFCVGALAIAACSGDDDDDAATTDAAAVETEAAPVETEAAPAETEAAPVETEPAPVETEPAPVETEPAGPDLAALGLWDDGPCDESLDPLHVGLQTVFQSGVLTLEDQAQALEASAVAFNARGGANGHCIKVTTCDDGADPNKALECVKELDEAGIAATVNDTTSVAGADVSAGYEAAGIPRFAISPGQDDYRSINAYPFDGGGTGTSLMMPQALLDAGITKIAIVRVDLPAATALKGFLEIVYGDDGAEFVADIPVPAGTTDFSQFILAAQDAGAEGLIMPIGGQEGIQVLRAGQQLDADLMYSSSLGSFPPSDIADLGDYADRVLLNAAIPPGLADDPVIDLLTEDLAVSGIEALQRENLKSSPMRSWVGLYALLHILRESGTEDFSRENIKALIDASGEIPMLGITNDWTPTADNGEAAPFRRTGTGYYAFWKFDGATGSFVMTSEADFNKNICGTVGPAC